MVTDVNLDKDQNRASIEVAVMEGIRKVTLAPRCEQETHQDRPEGAAAVRPRPVILLTFAYGAGLATGLARFVDPWTLIPLLIVGDHRPEDS